MHFASTWRKLLQQSIYLEVLVVEGLAQGAPQKDLLMAPFVERFKPTTLRESF